MFATGSADRTIKLWDLAKASVGSDDALKLTLTGHISPVRGLAFSDRHPYLFSCGEDKMIKCWDLETNQVIRHYHGHLSGIFCLALHPTLDLLVTGGRDAVARLWDIRSKTQIHVLAGHEHTVSSVLTRSTDPQVITGSHDCTIRLWDIVAGKSMATLTHHSKAIRALVQPSFEATFVSGAADCLKKWQSKDGRFIKSWTGHKSVINALAMNDDGVVVSGGDDGSLHFWDYGTGYSFQQTASVAQPGSLEAENGIYCASFDLTGTRLITGEADKSIKIWKPHEDASEMTHPIDMVGWRKKCLKEAMQRY
jgi:pleiotropic regulator 1